jgi:ATPase subunit of ABC transporter with duplicated ATPase domains
MKKYTLFFIIILFTMAGSSFQQVIAQEKTKEEAENDAQFRQAIEQQKKAMAEQKKVQIDMEKNMKKRNRELEYLSDSLNQERDNEGDERPKIFLDMPRGNKAFNFDGSYDLLGQDMAGFWGHSMGDADKSTWTFSKNVKDNTFSKDYSFDVEKSSKSVVMSVMGDCKSGEIRIKIVMPNGKNYSDILIDESGNLNWRKSFTISETENQDKTGDWKFQISSTKATGFFKISLQSF